MATAVEQPVESAPGLTWESFAQTPEWKHLTKRQRVWFIWRCATGDSVAATRMAFEVEPKNLRALAWGTEKNSYIREALAKWKGQSERDRFLAEVQAAIDKCEPGSVAQSRNLALMARLRFGVSDENESAVETNASKTSSPAKAGRFKVGDPVLINGEKRQVLAVNEAGEPVEVSDEVIQ